MRLLRSRVLRRTGFYKHSAPLEPRNRETNKHSPPPKMRRTQTHFQIGDDNLEQHGEVVLPDLRITTRSNLEHQVDR